MKKLTVKLIFVLFLVPVFVFAAEQKKAETKGPVRKVIKGKVFRVDMKSAGVNVVIMEIPNPDKKKWPERVEYPWGDNYYKDGKKMDRVSNINVWDDMAVEIIDTFGSERVQISGNPATPKFKEQPTSSSTTKIYIGKDARDLKPEPVKEKEEKK